MAAVAASALPATCWPSPARSRPAGQPAPQENAATQPGRRRARATALDPNLTKIYKPGDVLAADVHRRPEEDRRPPWPTSILPKDDYGPAASDVGVLAMVDEWISAPYPQQQADRPVILEGLAWLEAESTKRFSKGVRRPGRRAEARHLRRHLLRRHGQARVQEGAPTSSAASARCAAGATTPRPPAGRRSATSATSRWRASTARRRRC